MLNRSPTANIVARTCLTVRSYVECLPSSANNTTIITTIITTNVGGTITTSNTITAIANNTNISNTKPNNNIRKSLFLCLHGNAIA